MSLRLIKGGLKEKRPRDLSIFSQEIDPSAYNQWIPQTYYTRPFTRHDIERAYRKMCGLPLVYVIRGKT